MGLMRFITILVGGTKDKSVNELFSFMKVSGLVLVEPGRD